jgi:hypothetical protein
VWKLCALILPSTSSESPEFAAQAHCVAYSIMSLSLDSVGIIAEGGDESAQDIHQSYNRDAHFWQKYYSIFAEKYSKNI